MNKDRTYSIEFEGATLPGFDRGQVMTRFGMAFRLPPEQVERTFSGRRVILKRELTREDGEVKQHRLRALGLDVRLVPAAMSAESTHSVPSHPPTVQPVAAPTDGLALIPIDPRAHQDLSGDTPVIVGGAPTPTSAAPTTQTPVTCPKCGYVRASTDFGSADECPKCGVIYAKAIAAQAKRLTEKSNARTAKEPTRSGRLDASALLPVLASLIPLAVLVEYAFAVSEALGYFEALKRQTPFKSGPSGRLAGVIVALILVGGAVWITGILGSLRTSMTQTRVVLGLTAAYIVHQTFTGPQHVLSYPNSWSASTSALAATAVSSAVLAACLFVVMRQLLALTLDKPDETLESAAEGQK